MNPQLTNLEPTKANQWLVNAYLDFLLTDNREILDSSKYALLQDVAQDSYVKGYVVQLDAGLLIVGSFVGIENDKQITKYGSFLDRGYTKSDSYRITRDIAPEPEDRDSGDGAAKGDVHIA